MPLIGVFTPLTGVLIKIMWFETRYTCAFILKVPATHKKSLYVLSYEFKLVRAIIPTLYKAVPLTSSFESGGGAQPLSQDFFPFLEKSPRNEVGWGRGMGCNHLFVI